MSAKIPRLAPQKTPFCPLMIQSPCLDTFGIQLARVSGARESALGKQHQNNVRKLVFQALCQTPIGIKQCTYRELDVNKK